jgi:hypothetical protein
MKYDSNYIILKQSLRYLNEWDQNKLKNKLINLNVRHKSFLNCLVRNFNVEKFQKEPLVWQDIWLYNYIKYDSDKKPKRKELILKYETYIFIDDDKEFFSMKDLINSHKLISRAALNKLQQSIRRLKIYNLLHYCQQ